MVARNSENGDHGGGGIGPRGYRFLAGFKNLYPVLSYAARTVPAAET
jgi:hypothetical protein